jgi:MFS family permease
MPETDDAAIVQAIGYRGTSIQLHSVPPYVCSTFTSLVACYMGDRLRHRGTFVVIAGCVSIAGYAMYLSSTNLNVLYASLFLQIMGVYTVAPLQSTWMRESLVHEPVRYRLMQ